MIGISLSGGRDSLLTLLIAHRYASRATAGRAGLAAARLLPAVALFLGRDATRARRRSARSGRAARDRLDRRGLRARAGGGSAIPRRSATVTELTKQNIQARLRGATDVELVELRRRALPADRQHERKGGRLHHDRRRSDGRAGRARQRAEDGRDGAARLLCARSTATRASRRCWPNRPGRSWPRISSARRS